MHVANALTTFVSKLFLSLFVFTRDALQSLELPFKPTGPRFDAGRLALGTNRSAQVDETPNLTYAQTQSGLL